MYPEETELMTDWAEEEMMRQSPYGFGYGYRPRPYPYYGGSPFFGGYPYYPYYPHYPHYHHYHHYPYYPYRPY
ncbi:hypothetical protein [Pseudobacillus wudalianchiensis]|uniref:Uncharacterized protein n=1 Tax=Pseudobacillus wudalianchiensis TaxID=1743143 RepID=A0A1B9AYX4_9BACI|nr:hypothetical protein [Bacillus wudalianchiensis]OCA88981.1 hypothetical protein A8F95_06080 [Bacillus wudalianchiensis]